MTDQDAFSAIVIPPLPSLRDYAASWDVDTEVALHDQVVNHVLDTLHLADTGERTVAALTDLADVCTALEAQLLYTYASDARIPVRVLLHLLVDGYMKATTPTPGAES